MRKIKDPVIKKLKWYREKNGSPQIYIPAEMIDELKLKHGAPFLVTLENGKIILEPVEIEQ